MSSTSLTVLIAATVVVTFVSLFLSSPFRLSRGWKIERIGNAPHRTRQPRAYEDEDGKALPSTATSDASRDRWVRFLAPALALGGLVLSCLRSVLLSFTSSTCMIFGDWVFVTILAFVLATAPVDQPARFRIGLYLGLSSFSSCLALVLDMYDTLLSSPYRSIVTIPIAELVRWALLGSGLCLTWTSLSVYRRSTVYYEKAVVDEQFTCSAAQRYTFAWVRPLLDQARKVSTLGYLDLPMLDHATRSQRLLDQFPLKTAHFTASKPLWKALVWNHRKVIIRQWTIAVVESVVMLLPPICLYKILSLLENRSDNDADSTRTQIALWVACLTASKLLHVCLDTWLQWVSFAILATPVRSQLFALIFAKSLRMKIVAEDNIRTKDKVPTVRQEPEYSEGDAEEAHEMDTFLPRHDHENDETPSDSGEKDDEAEGIAKGIVNLLGVDVQRISDFCGYNVDLIRGFAKAILASAFLIVLLGWSSTLAGLAIPFILQPLNRIATKHYTSKQLDVMSARDEKAHVVSEALHGMRQIKFSATEAQWQKLILSARDRELRAQWSVYVWAIFLTFAWIAMPTLIGAAALSVYAWLGRKMIASVAFTALSVFSSLEWTISSVPTTITEMLDARVSVDRVQQHLNSPERQSCLASGNAVIFENASISWPSRAHQSACFTLSKLNLSFPLMQLSVIHGKTGTGKSLLLAAIIGEADVLEGTIRAPHAPPMSVRDNERVTAQNWVVADAFAYVSQVPWIENASIKDTILYGLPYRHDRYMQTLHACALHDDLRILPDGDRTEVGATGINLSGGQRWRLTLARALYSRAGFLVLDDIFSAVDAHVGRHILENALVGELGANRTRILVTHHVGLVERFAKYIVNLDSGTTMTTPLSSDGLSDSNGRKTQSVDEFSTVPLYNDTPPSNRDDAGTARKFVADEERQEGAVKFNVYKTYIMASGGRRYWVLTVMLFSLAAAGSVARSYWLTLWTEQYTLHQTDHDSQRESRTGSPHSDPNVVFYLSVYITISLVSISLISVKVMMVLVASLRAARHLFEKAAYNVLRAHLRWLDTEPVGRILNRFVGDFALIDSRLGGDLMWCANGFFSIGTIIAAALFVSAWMLLPVAVLSFVGIYIAYLYLDGARDTKRLESTAKSPLFELVESSLSGLDTIRSFGRVDEYLDRMFHHIDRYTQASWYILLSSQWMRFRQGTVGAIFTLCIACGVVYSPEIGASLAGFALSFALDFSAVAEETISRYTSMELDMNSTERVLEYMRLSTESSQGATIGPTWPSRGQIEVRNLEVGYAHDLQSVLRGVNFTIQPHERVGIVGRTGSGKSSLTLALFRFLEARQGTIKIDGIDIASLRLHDLRSRLAIIPQDPVLFSGTLRSNLDPFDEYSDEILLEALERVHLISSRETQSSTKHLESTRANVFESLASSVTRGGSNLSQGQKQLLCLARAMVTRPRILVLDEATSAVDMETDGLIQLSIRKEFQHTTLLVVAHRLSTVADFDKILVMSDGRAAEFDRPSVLAQRKKGSFRKMIEDSGEKAALHDLLKHEAID